MKTLKLLFIVVGLSSSFSAVALDELIYSRIAGHVYGLSTDGGLLRFSVVSTTGKVANCLYPAVLAGDPPELVAVRLMKFNAYTAIVANAKHTRSSIFVDCLTSTGLVHNINFTNAAQQ